MRKRRKSTTQQLGSVGLRATKPNEYWHVDTSIVRLLDGTRVYLHAILDNFSRRILAWRLNDTFETATTAELLKEAAKGLPDGTVPSAVMDSGVENVNGTVNELVSDGTIQLGRSPFCLSRADTRRDVLWDRSECSSGPYREASDSESCEVSAQSRSIV